MLDVPVRRAFFLDYCFVFTFSFPVTVMTDLLIFFLSLKPTFLDFPCPLLSFVSLCSSLAAWTLDPFS